MTHLSKDSLFLKLATSEISKEPTLLDLYTNLQTSTNYDSLITSTYYLIKSPTLSQSQILKLWQIRLTLHLFNNQLNYAKKEAINLNNALYLYETATTAHDITGTTPIYPLPKQFDFNLLILLLRLKSIPNMNLINELFKLNYQLRLKNGQELSIKLINLSFDVIVVLLVTNNYLIIQSMLNDLSCQLKDMNEESYAKYRAQVSLLSIIIDSRIYSQAIVQEKYVEQFKKLDQDTKNALVYALTTEDEQLPVDFSLSDLIKLNLSNRIITALLAIWDLSNTYPFKLIHQDKLEFVYVQQDKEEENDDLSSDWLVDLAYDEVNKHWNENITKFYGLE